MSKSADNQQPGMTIVGGQPHRRHRFPGKVQVPIGVEKLLVLAAENEAFKKKLLDDRCAAIAEANVQLRPSEIAMLSAISSSALATMIDSIVPANPKRRRFMGLVAAAAASLAAGTVDISCEKGQSRGSGPDTDVDGGADGSADRKMGINTSDTDSSGNTDVVEIEPIFNQEGGTGPDDDDDDMGCDCQTVGAK